MRKKHKNDDKYLTVRLKRSTVERVDRLAERLAARSGVGADGARVTRSAAIDHALDACEAGEKP